MTRQGQTGRKAGAQSHGSLWDSRATERRRFRTRTSSEGHPGTIRFRSRYRRVGRSRSRVSLLRSRSRLRAEGGRASSPLAAPLVPSERHQRDDVPSTRQDPRRVVARGELCPRHPRSIDADLHSWRSPLSPSHGPIAVCGGEPADESWGFVSGQRGLVRESATGSADRGDDPLPALGREGSCLRSSISCDEEDARLQNGEVCVARKEEQACGSSGD